MGQAITLDTPAGRIGGWRAAPDGEARGALVVVQEIFGVNAHVRGVVDGLAGHGYIALAPALFDLVEADVALDYDEAGIARGRELAASVGFDRAVAMVRGAADSLAAGGHAVGVVGYCWGGSVAYLANTRLKLPAVSYYGGRSVPFLHERLGAPMLFHFGVHDPLIPPADIEKHRVAHPEARIEVHDAGHGFNCEMRADHRPAAAARALAQTIDFFQQHLRPVHAAQHA